MTVIQEKEEKAGGVIGTSQHHNIMGPFYN
jgi:hypothetical protein